jgi:hypothetical protein
LLTRSHRRSLILLTFFTYVALFILALLVIIPPRGNTFDFYPRYVGARAIFAGESPYSRDVTRRIQQGMYGDTLPADADQQRFAYPAYAGILLAPFAALPVRVATAAWMALQPVALIGSCLIWLDLIGWRFRRIWAAWLLCAAVILIFRYPFALYLLGQFTGVIALCIALAAWWLARHKPVRAGVAFAVATIQPTMTAPLALLTLGYSALRERKAWRGLIAFIIALAVLTGISTLLIGWWIPDFLNGLRDYSGYATYYVWAPALIESPVLRGLFVAGVMAAVVVSLIHLPEMRAKQASPLRSNGILPSPRLRARGVGGEGYMPLFTFIPATLLLIPQTGSYYLILLLPLILASLHNATKLRGGRRLLAWALSLAVLFAPWLYLLMPESARQYEALLLPLQAWATWQITEGMTR